MTDALSFLEAVAGFSRGRNVSSADRPIRLAVIDPAYDPWDTYPAAPPPARVTFEGESDLSGKAYPIVAGFIPRAGVRVWLLPVGNTYVIGGQIDQQVPQGFWSDVDGADAGVEFGGGSYFDASEGLVLAGDAAIAGDLSIGIAGKSVPRGVVLVNSSTSSSGNYTTTLTNMANLTDLLLRPGRAYRISHGPGVQQTNTGYVDVRLFRSTGTTATLWEFCRYPINTAGVVMACQGEGYIRNTSAGNITMTLQLQMAASAGTGFHAAPAGRPRYLMAEDVGAAADFPHAVALTS